VLYCFETIVLKKVRVNDGVQLIPYWDWVTLEKIGSLTLAGKYFWYSSCFRGAFGIAGR
jgi:hypothetical protein